jgi:hypothetical protein
VPVCPIRIAWRRLCSLPQIQFILRKRFEKRRRNLEDRASGQRTDWPRLGSNALHGAEFGNRPVVTIYDDAIPAGGTVEIFGQPGLNLENVDLNHDYIVA